MGATVPPAVQAHGLPLRWAGLSRFVILDAGFGRGEHFLAAWRAWQADPARPSRLHYLALCAAPLAPDLLPAALRPDWPPAVAGFHRLAFDDGRVTLDLMVGPLAASLAQIVAHVDAIYLNDPACSPRALAALARHGATLDAPAVDAARRRALADAGFDCGAEPDANPDANPDAPLRAVFSSRRPQPPRFAPQERRAIVIGAGVAGAAACERLCARGWQVTLIERHALPAQEASANLAGIFLPQLSRDDNPVSRLRRNAFLFAQRHWRALGGIGVAFSGARCGVLQLARDAAHARVQERIAAAANYPPEYARWLSPSEAGDLLGRPAPDGGWLYPQGGWARPSTLCAALLDACGARLERRFSSCALALVRDGDLWRVRDAAGASIASAPTVILANGVGATAFEQAAALPLAAVRGQVTHLPADSVPVPPLVVCRDAYMTLPSDGVVCVGATYDADDERGLRQSSQRDNLERLGGMLGAPFDALADAAPLAGRVGFRCVAPDRLPLVGALPDATLAGAFERLRDVPRQSGLHGLLGYASHGISWASLAAELLAAQLEGEPLPLEANLAAALDPARFLLRARRRAGGAP